MNPIRKKLEKTGEFYNNKNNIKPSLAYIRKTTSMLKKAVEDVKDSCARLEKIGEWEKENSIKARVLRRKLNKAIIKLDKAASMYFKIDYIREDYVAAQRDALGKLRKIWHSIKFDLPSRQWELVKKIILKNKLENAKIIIKFGAMEQSFEQYTGQRYR